MDAKQSPHDRRKLYLERLVCAWNYVKNLPPEHPNSFFKIAGYHGEPFDNPPAHVEAKYYWGGYCQHGNVLFPTWHRAYLLKLEEALLSCGDTDFPSLALPFWNTTNELSQSRGLSPFFTDPCFHFNGEEVPNPFLNFTLPENLDDNSPNDISDNGLGPYYKKHKGYTTVRYPLSGLVGNEKVRKLTECYNESFSPERRVELLNENVKTWINGPENKPTGDISGIYKKYLYCLNAPNYTVFSNTTSANQAQSPTVPPFYSLESPHNDCHLSIGGFHIDDSNFNSSAATFANGDMGENNTAGFDPIFFFHHCNVDRMFWIWQQRYESTTHLVIDPTKEGAVVDPKLTSITRHQKDKEQLCGSTPLYPFQKADNVYYTSDDVANIVSLNYAYANGSLDEYTDRTIPIPTGTLGNRIVKIEGINLEHSHAGSMVLSVAIKCDNNKYHLGF